MTEGTMIQSTTDYNQFQFMKGNRNIDLNHVDKLRKAMLKNPDWFRTDPGVVNEHGFIIDGQHRYRAAERAQKPFYYVVGQKLNLDTAREMNIRQKQWALEDYARSYADSGRESYSQILTMRRQYPRLSLGTMIVACTGVHDYTLTHAFKAGTFEIEDLDLANERCSMLNTIVEKTGRFVSVPFARILVKLVNDDHFDTRKFMAKLDEKPELLVPSGNARDNYRTIEDVYNHNAKKIIRLY
jgi:hypothetical protein